MLPNKQSDNATRLNLKRLMMLRLVVILSLSMVIAILRYLSIPLHVTPLLISLCTLVILNAFTWWHLKQHQHTKAITLFLQLLGDLAAFTSLFYFSGGYSNPFIWMYLLPITVAAVALRLAYAWVIASISMLCYTALMFYHQPLSHLHVHAGGLFNQTAPLDIHLVGMWFGFVVSSMIVVIFIARIGKNLRDYDHSIAQVREKALESERVLALGTLAANAAHELGTPLATMRIITQTLIEDYAEQPALLAQLSLLKAQTIRCKDILSTMTRDAGLARAEVTETITLVDFIQQTLSRWRDTRPATELIVNLPVNSNKKIMLMDRSLTQALMNLLDNAADESPEQIIFKANWDDKILHIQVRDFGVGLTEESQQKVGTPIFSSKKETGMGLGLYLTQLTIARYEGELALHNHAERGVVAQIRIPLLQLCPASLNAYR